MPNLMKNEKLFIISQSLSFCEIRQDSFRTFTSASAPNVCFEIAAPMDQAALRVVFVLRE